MTTTPALTIEHLSKTYPNGHTALKGISFSVQPGDFFGLLGPNGAGKTTTIGILTSLVNKTAGHVSIFGHDIDKNFSLAKTYMGVVPQEFNFNIFEKVLQIVVSQAGYYGIPSAIAHKSAEILLKKLGLWKYRNTPARLLSGGMKRRLMIARALAHHPKLLILDEPTAGVDVELRRTLWQYLREINNAGTTIILTTHYLEEAENLCKNIAIIDQGNIIAHTDVASLLRQLRMETFVFYLKTPLENLPILPGYTLRLIDPMTLEIEVDHTHSLNDLFSTLTQHQIAVESMRNKVTRLEELFVNLVGKTEE